VRSGILRNVLAMPLNLLLKVFHCAHNFRKNGGAAIRESDLFVVFVRPLHLKVKGVFAHHTGRFSHFPFLPNARVELQRPPGSLLAPTNCSTLPPATNQQKEKQ